MRKTVTAAPLLHFCGHWADTCRRPRDLREGTEHPEDVGGDSHEL